MDAQEPRQVREDAAFEPRVSLAPPVAEQSEFEFDVALSTAIKINGRRHANQQRPKGSLSPDMLDRIWEFATNDGGKDPDVVLACAGDVPTLEMCACSWLLQKYVPDIKVRVVNVVDLGILRSSEDHPHGMDDISFGALFTEAAPVIFAFHGYPWVIHPMVHGRSNEGRFHVRGFRDRGTTTTPFDMVVLNKMSRFHLAMDALTYIPRLRSQASDVVDMFNRKLSEHYTYIRESLQDLPEIKNWRWTSDLTEPAGPPLPVKGSPHKQLFSDA